MQSQGSMPVMSLQLTEYLVDGIQEEIFVISFNKFSTCGFLFQTLSVKLFEIIL